MLIALKDRFTGRKYVKKTFFRKALNGIIIALFYQWDVTEIECSYLKINGIDQKRYYMGRNSYAGTYSKTS
jgi:hypothetical protein